jgi:hypothetical protein
LTPALAKRSVEESGWNEVIRRNSELLTTGIAILILLATVIAPLCGPICARDKGCAVGMAPRGSEGADCHHVAMSNEIGAPRSHFGSAKPCTSTELPSATLNPRKNWDELRQLQTSAALSLDAAASGDRFPSSLDTEHARWRGINGPSGTHEKVVKTIALRI